MAATLKTFVWYQPARRELAAGDKKITAQGIWVKQIFLLCYPKNAEGSINGLKDPTSIF